MAMAAIAALASVGCNKVELSSNEPVRKAGDLVIKASIPQTKVAIASDADGYSMTWDTNDKAALISAGTLYESSAITLSGDKKTAEFTFTDAVGVSGDYDIFAPLTYDKNNAINNIKVSDSGITATIAQSQAPKSIYPNGFVLKGSGSTPELNVAFDHLATYVKMTIKGLLPEEAVHHINVYMWQSNLAGDITFDEDGEPVYDGHSNDSNNIYIGTWDMGGKADSDGVLTIWFSAKPFTILQGRTFQVTLNSETAETHKLELKAKKDIECPVGTVVSLPMTIPSVKYTVSFNTNGGSAIEPVKVEEGDCVTEPEDPSMQLAEGLYPGAPDDIKGEFLGWYANSGLTEAYDFSTPVTSDITLYAKWGAAPEKIDLSAWEGLDNYTVVHGALKYVNSQTLSEETHYTLVLTSDKQFYGGADGLNKANAVLHIVGQGAERKIFANSKWFSILTVSGPGTIVLEKNLLLYNLTIDKNSVINIYGAGTVIMNEGCRLSGSRSATESTGIVVRMDNGGCKFIMNGGEICDNQSESNVNQSVIYINGGRFEMHGGVISDNTISTTGADTYISGAILFNGWAYITTETSQRSFVKDGGEIKNNTATRNLAEEAEITGSLGQQFLIIDGAKKKIDVNVSATTNLDAKSCYSYPWTDAVVK